MPIKEVSDSLNIFTKFYRIPSCSLYTNYLSLADLDHITFLTLVVIQVHCTQITAICLIMTNDKIINVYLQELIDFCLVLLKMKTFTSLGHSLLVQDHQIPNKIWLVRGHSTVLYAT